jgi:putative holliday junction resolvase
MCRDIDWLPARLDASARLCSNASMRRGRVLALDYGTKNVGFACSDELRITIQPLASAPNVGRRKLIDRIRGIIQEREIGELVVGMPLNMDGSSGNAARRVHSFINALGAGIHIPVRSFDERLSTVEALETWHLMSPKQRRKFRTVDSLAAACILERYLRETELCEPA